MRKSLKQILIILSILLLMGFVFLLYESQQNESQPEEGYQEITTKESSASGGERELRPQPPSFGILLSTIQPQQGDTLVIEAVNVPAGEKIAGFFDGQSFDFFPIGTDGKQIGIVGIDVRKTPGDYSLSVSIPNEDNIIKTITIKKRDFPVTELALTPELEEKGYTPSNIVENISTKEGVLIWQVLEKYTPESYFDKPFLYPLDSVINVGAFGNIRKKGDISLRHLGVDLGAAVGTPVYAVNDGIVSFVKELTVYGKMIIIDHGLGIYSLYLHLEEFKVAEGDKVNRGEVIGLSGSTGYSLGPHLHLSIKAKGASVDPLRFINTLKHYSSV